MRQMEITAETYRYKFNPEDYQKSDLFQLYSHKYAVWCNFHKYYEAKKQYYDTGVTTLSDFEFDCLERSLKALAGPELFKKYSCVGYCSNTHKIASFLFNHFDSELRRRFFDPWNAYAREFYKSLKEKQKPEPIKVEEPLEQKEEEPIVPTVLDLKTETDGQIIMPFF